MNINPLMSRMSKDEMSQSNIEFIDKAIVDSFKNQTSEKSRQTTQSAVRKLSIIVCSDSYRNLINASIYSTVMWPQTQQEQAFLVIINITNFHRRFTRCSHLIRWNCQCPLRQHYLRHHCNRSRSNKSSDVD